MVNIILYLNDPMSGIEMPKANKSQNLLRKAICIKTKYWTILVQDCQSSSLSMIWKLNTSLTQKDTMDRGAWIKNLERRHAGGLKRKDKSPKAQKCKMAWEWGTNEYFCLPYVTILWCPSWELPKDKGKKMKFIFLVSKELSRLWNLGFHFSLNWPIIND